MSDINKINQAIEVLTRAQDQLVSEIATCGSGGNVGRAQSYAPVLVNISNALSVVLGLQEKSESPGYQDKMAYARAAKAAKQAAQA